MRHSISIDAPAEKIYPLIASGSGFSQWWAADVTQPGPPGIVELAFFKRATVYRLELARAVEPREAEWRCTTGQEWSGTKLLFAMTPTSGPTPLRFTHADWKSETDYFVSCTTVWGELMFRLKAAAEGKPTGPLFSETGLAY